MGDMSNVNLSNRCVVYNINSRIRSRIHYVPGPAADETPAYSRVPTVSTGRLCVRRFDGLPANQFPIHSAATAALCLSYNSVHRVYLNKNLLSRTTATGLHYNNNYDFVLGFSHNYRTNAVQPAKSRKDILHRVGGGGRTTRTTAVRGGGNRKGIKRLSGISHIHKSTSTAGAYAQNVLRAVLSGFKIENGE
ncbi:hypothetical protein QTP88_012959 [Uroleucon formosanum]